MPVEYSVEDRSILLPWYKKAVVDPVVRRLPATLHPNTITHAGHLLNLLGLAAVIAVHPRGPSAVYVIPAITLHLYNLCDNADGAHARATGQTSPLGELLDHGLDLLNVAYIALLGALAIGATPLWTTAMVTSVTGAAAAVYWEQAETGVFQLGLLNQVEATFLLAAVLVACALFGPDVVGGLSPLPGSALTVRTVTAAVVTLGAVAAMLHGALRVSRRRGALAPFVTLALFGAGAVALVASGALPWPAGAALGVILAALYMLGAVQKMFFGKLTHPENKKLTDINGRELIAVTPLIGMIFIVGFFPRLLLDPMSGAIARIHDDYSLRTENNPAPKFYTGPIKLLPRRPEAPKRSKRSLTR